MARGRQKIVPFDERVADRIRVSMIVGKLQNHIDDPVKHPLLMTQIHASRLLLNKVVPDVKALDISTLPHIKDVNGISNDRLRTIINGNGS